MDRAAFEEGLTREGYSEIRTNQMEPNRHNPEHTHPWDARALILEGDITLTVDGKRTTYQAGDIFMMQAGCRHIEDIGPQGVKYLVGRRPANAKA